MIKIKNIILFLLIFLIFIEKGFAEISNRLFMTIGNKPITQSDIVNEIKLILILNNEKYSEEKRDKLQEAAVKSTIKRIIKLIELERHNFFKFSEIDFQTELNRLAGNIFVDLETLKNICASNDLDFSIIENQVKTELYWNSLIFEIYKNKLVVNQDQIDEQLKLTQNKQIEEYLISEIVIKKVEENNLGTVMEELKNKIEIEGFENVAKNFSISDSSLNGGDLGWINENVLSEKIKSILVNTPVGATSEPIILAEGILIFKVREKREVSSTLTMEQIKNQLVNSQKTKILNMHSLSHYDKVRRSVSIKFFNE